MKNLQHLVAATLVLALGATTHSLQAEPFLYPSGGAGSRLVKLEFVLGGSAGVLHRMAGSADWPDPARLTARRADPAQGC